ncbi:MAG: hypothetical protein JWN15_3598 [Firmicutes bacterium]|nr:hypothetical protein [Bacillota bacterium]
MRTVTAATTADAVRWERPGDVEQTWFWDEYLCPAPVSPLTQSFYPYTTQAFARNQREFWERRGALRVMFVSGYLYVNPDMGGRPPATAMDRARESMQRWEQEWLPEVAANVERLRALPLTTMAEDELARSVIDALSVTMRHWQIEGQVDGPALLAIREFAAWYQERFPNRPEQESYRLLQGQVHAPLAATQELWELTQLVTPAVADALRVGQPALLPEPFRSGFMQYLDRYGCRTEQMYDIGSPTWLEEPSPVMTRMLRAAEEAMPDPREATTRLADEAEALAADVRSSLPAEEAAKFDTLLVRARTATRAKEDHKLRIEQMTPGAVRAICAELSRRMIAVNLLEDPADLAFLTLAELIEFGFGLAQPQLGALIADRKAEHMRNLEVRPVPWLGTNPDEPDAEEPVSGEPQQPVELMGRGASPGVVTGMARVLTDPADTAMLRRGEILVCPWTDPDWTPLLAVASAIVTDTGGVVSHAAVVAREFGLPAVVGATGATRLIKTGQLIRVDGTNGIITLRP